MTARTLAAIAFRVWGVVMLVTSVVSVATQSALLFSSASSVGRPSWYPWAILVSFIGPAIVGIVLVVLADPVATRLEPDTMTLAIDAGPRDLTVLGFGLAGIFVLVWALQDIASIVYGAVSKPDWMSSVSGSSYLWGQQSVAIVRAIVECAAGLILVLGRDGLATAWTRLRGGLQESDADTDA